jgi:hypothetical protein
MCTHAYTLEGVGLERMLEAEEADGALTSMLTTVRSESDVSDTKRCRRSGGGLILPTEAAADMTSDCRGSDSAE